MSRTAPPAPPRPASVARAVTALATHELRMTARRGENLLVTLVIPIAVLLFFSVTNVLPGMAGDRVDFLLPGALALAVIGTCFVSLGISTAYERSYGALKRLGGAPLPRWGLVAAKLAAALAFVVVQAAALFVVASLVLGWAPGAGWSPLLAVAAAVLGALAFAGLGMLMAGTLRAETTLALANGLFLAFLMLGGIVLPIGDLPAQIQPVATLLPSTALAELLRVALDTGLAPGSSGEAARYALVLVTWGVAGTALAIGTFRWD